METWASANHVLPLADPNSPSQTYLGKQQRPSPSPHLPLRNENDCAWRWLTEPEQPLLLRLPQLHCSRALLPSCVFQQAQGPLKDIYTSAEH